MTWLERAAAEKSEADMMEAKLAPDMRPLPAQYQMACDTAKNALARLSGTDAPAVADTETSFAELRDRCDRTVAYAPEDAAHLLMYLVDECVDAEIEVHEIRADTVVVHELTGSKTEASVVHRGIVITADADCRGRLDLYPAPVERSSQ